MVDFTGLLLWKMNSVPLRSIDTFSRMTASGLFHSTSPMVMPRMAWPISFHLGCRPSLVIFILM